MLIEDLLVFISLVLHSYHSCSIFWEGKWQEKHSLQLFPTKTCDFSFEMIGAQAGRGVWWKEKHQSSADCFWLWLKAVNSSACFPGIVFVTWSSCYAHTASWTAKPGRIKSMYECICSDASLEYCHTQTVSKPVLQCIPGRVYNVSWLAAWSLLPVHSILQVWFVLFSWMALVKLSSLVSIFNFQSFFFFFCVVKMQHASACSPALAWPYWLLTFSGQP